MPSKGDCEGIAADTVLSQMVICYLFLGGAGAGACAVLCALALAVPRDAVASPPRGGARGRAVASLRPPLAYRRLFAPGFALSAGTLAVGCLCLLGDLGMGERALLLFAYPMPTFITAGSFALVLDIAGCVVLACAWGLLDRGLPYRFVCGLEIAMLACSLFVMVYTGLLLSTMGTVPLWSSVWLPVLFLLSAASSGIALVAGCGTVTQSASTFKTVFRRLLAADIVLIILEALAAACLLASAYWHPYGVGSEGVRELLSGSLALPFVFGFGVCGLAAPAVLEAGSVALNGDSWRVSFAIAALVLVGALCMRYGIVGAGLHPQAWIGVG